MSSYQNKVITRESFILAVFYGGTSKLTLTSREVTARLERVKIYWSIRTVARTLDVLVERGLLVKIIIGKRKCKYEQIEI